MKKNILYIFFTFSALVLSSCSDYLDINDDPTRIKSANLAALLPGCIEATSQNHYLVARTGASLISQHLAAVSPGGADTHDEIRMDGAWSNIYLRSLANLNQIVKQGTEVGAPHFVGIAKILQAVNLGLATDAWGDIPYTQAFNVDNFTPAYDSQESIYTAIQKLLDEAIVELQKANPSFPVGTSDLIFGGSAAKWLKVAHFYKARNLLHLSKRTGGSKVAAEILALLPKALANNSDDFQLTYNNRNLNPWHSNVALANNTGNLTVKHSQQFMDALNGVTWGVVDPRLTIVADNNIRRIGTVTTWTGTENGTGTGGNCDLSASTWHSRAESPILMATFAEQKFIEAEALFLQAGGTFNSKGAPKTAYAAYQAGIAANMDKVGVLAADRDKFIKDTKIDIGEANLTMQLIMNQKFIALFLNPETWNDMRRYDYSKEVFRDLDIPKKQNPTLAGQWIRRVLYPLDEFARNGDQVKKVQKGLPDKLWWDQ